MKIAYINGSLSKNSIHRTLAQTLFSVAPADVQIEEVKIGDLPLYTQDLDDETIESYQRVRKQIQEADAILMTNPEHNRSFSAALKNFIDIASRPYGQNLWAQKKVALISASPGAVGGFVGLIQLRHILQSVGAKVLIQPEVFISNVYTLLDKEGKLSDEKTLTFLKNFGKTFFDFAKA